MSGRNENSSEQEYSEYSDSTSELEEDRYHYFTK